MMSRTSNHRPKLFGQPKMVAFCPETREYLGYDCTSATKDRNYAWVGTPTQSVKMKEAFPFAKRFSIYYDGDERLGSSDSGQEAGDSWDEQSLLD